jgi:hypothetical protein
MENPHKSMQNMIITTNNILICWNIHQLTTKFMHKFWMHHYHKGINSGIEIIETRGDKDVSCCSLT